MKRSGPRAEKRPRKRPGTRRALSRRLARNRVAELSLLKARRNSDYARVHPPVLHELFRALADPTRLRLLNLINGREVCVCYLAEILRISQPKISRHLAYLRREGLVETRREGKWMHYRLAIPKNYVAKEILQATLERMERDPRMRYDLAHLEAACCAPKDYEIPSGAPPPQEFCRPEDAPYFPRPS